ncbi:MAG TPA: alkaline phosphatase family protein, partial [Bryobacteraceae bacterium]
MNRRSRTFLFSLAIVTTLFGAPPKRPKLVLAIVVDQFRYDYLLRFRGDYRSGLLRLLEHGAVFHDAHYLHAATVTAVGHSTFLTGATPSVSGIVANEWYDRETARTITSVFDPRTKQVGGIPNRPGASPRRLLVDTVGDELKMQAADSKVVGISIKDRSAILPGGHMADGAYWYDLDANAWVTSTYYRDTLPDWAAKVNREQPYTRSIGASWLPFDAKDAAALSQDDVEAVTWKRVVDGRTFTAADYAASVATVHRIGRAVARFFADHDLLLTPTMCQLPYPLGVLDMMNTDGAAYMAALQASTGFTALFNFAGNPAITLPLGWSRSGLPIGAQF